MRKIPFELPIKVNNLSNTLFTFTNKWQHLMKDSKWFVYMLRCSDNSLYTGITTDTNRRLKEHNECNKRGAKYTRVRRPVKLAYIECLTSRQDASKREYQLKKLSKVKKEHLVVSNTTKLSVI